MIDVKRGSRKWMPEMDGNTKREMMERRRTKEGKGKGRRKGREMEEGREGKGKEEEEGREGRRTGGSAVTERLVTRREKRDRKG